MDHLAAEQYRGLIWIIQMQQHSIPLPGVFLHISIVLCTYSLKPSIDCPIAIWKDQYFLSCIYFYGVCYQQGKQK